MKLYRYKCKRCGCKVEKYLKIGNFGEYCRTCAKRNDYERHKRNELRIRKHNRQIEILYNTL